MNLFSIIRILTRHSKGLPFLLSSHDCLFILLSMAYIRAIDHGVFLMMQIVGGGHAQVYANVLHARFGFHPTLVYIEKEVILKSGKVNRTIFQLSFCNNEGHLWLLPPWWYKAFEFKAAIMAAFKDLIL